MGLETRKATSFVELMEMRVLLRAHILPVTTNTPNDPTKDEKKTIYLRSTKEMNQSIIVATISCFPISCSGNCGSKWGRMSLINHYSEINWRILEDLNRISFWLWFFYQFFPIFEKKANENHFGIEWWLLTATSEIRKIWNYHIQSR